uniref:Ankyrin repeat and BTB domain containing 1 n=1 Tax=Microcebus murinus TaxID=30608 RepID=A0A8C6EKF0_MICMU
MDTSDLFSSCRKGDVGRVRYLLEQRDVEVNVRDKWDSTPFPPPLSPVVAGARCEANTFDGERCLYGALSDAIRRALRDYKQVTSSCGRRDCFRDFLQRLLEQGLHSDIAFQVHGRRLRAHRCVLGARSDYLARALGTRWRDKGVVVLRHPLVRPRHLPFSLCRLPPPTPGWSECQGESRLAKQCHLWDLLGDLEAKREKVSEFVASKPGTCVKAVTIEPAPGDPRLRRDFARLAERALPAELRGDLWELPFPCPDDSDSFPSRPDVCFRVGNCAFPCHKAFFCGRSDYFRALLDGHFRETEEEPGTSGDPQTVALSGVSPETFAHVLRYVYSDHTELPPEAAYDVLGAADMYLLPGLKRLCGRSLAQLLHEDTVVGVWRVAKLFHLARLEDQCAQFMAKVLDKVRPAVREEAAAVASRQETDSIPLVDDIRFHVAAAAQTHSAAADAQRRLRALQDLLVALGLDC